MKKLITNFILIFSILVFSGCTYFTYTTKDGRSATFISSKEYRLIEVEIEKEHAKVIVEGVTSDIVKDVVEGAVEGMSISSGDSLAKEIIKR